MAQVTIQGTRIDNICITRDGDEIKLTASYSLMSSSGKVLARQDVNGYNTIKVEPSADTVKAMDAYIKAFKSDVDKVLGLDSE